MILSIIIIMIIIIITSIIIIIIINIISIMIIIIIIIIIIMIFVVLMLGGLLVWPPILPIRLGDNGRAVNGPRLEIVSHSDDDCTCLKHFYTHFLGIASQCLALHGSILNFRVLYDQ